MRSAVLILLLVSVGCRAPKLPKDCGAPVSGTHSVPSYVFMDSNFSCEEEDAIATSFDLDAGSFFRAAGLGTADVIADFEKIADDWSNTGAELHVTVGSTSLSPGVDVRDGAYHVFMVDDDDGIGDGTNSIALTSVRDDGDGSTVDCDIRVFRKRHDDSVRTFVANGSPGSTDTDLDFILAHEMGHCVGLGDQEDPALANALMFGSYAAGTEYMGIHALDEEAAVMIYGSI